MIVARVARVESFEEEEEDVAKFVADRPANISDIESEFGPTTFYALDNIFVTAFHFFVDLIHGARIQTVATDNFKTVAGLKSATLSDC